jgi:hypothetical protein
VHHHSREADLTCLWWIQGEISATLTAVAVDKIKKASPMGFPMATIYYQYTCPGKRVILKKLKPPSLSIKGHV